MGEPVANTSTVHDLNAAQPLSSCDFDVDRVRADFPALHQQINGRPLVYLDNAASSQTPQVVIDALNHYYQRDCANIHRGVHTLSQRATRAYEQARGRVQHLINAPSAREVIFTSGTTGAINLVAQTYGRQQLSAGDEVLITEMEHHSNIVPWQLLCEQTGATLRVAPINDAAELVLEAFDQLLGERTKIVALTHMSNALGTINPVEPIIRKAHAAGAVVLLDGAQAAPHVRVDVQKLGCDFYAFSGHKLYGPTGIGVLYGREALLEAMPPYQGGGDMIELVTFDKTTYAPLPHKFEAGTPNIAGAIGLGVAADYFEAVGIERAADYEVALLRYANDALLQVPGLRMIGTSVCRASVLSFVLEGIHAHDIGTILDHHGIAIRAGHHCAQPVMQHFGVPATARASLAFYNTREEVDALVQGLQAVREVLG